MVDSTPVPVLKGQGCDCEMSRLPIHRDTCSTAHAIRSMAKQDQRALEQYSKEVLIRVTGQRVEVEVG